MYVSDHLCSMFEEPHGGTENLTEGMAWIGMWCGLSVRQRGRTLERNVVDTSLERAGTWR